MVDKSDSEVIPIEAAGGYVLKPVDGGVKLLMIFRRGVWDLPKGKLDPGETPAQCAIREVAEETGAEDLAIIGGAGMTMHRYVEDGASILKTTWWFVMTTPSEKFRPEAREQIESVEWVDWARAREIVGYETLRRHMDMVDEAIGELKSDLARIST